MMKSSFILLGILSLGSAYAADLNLAIGGIVRPSENNVLLRLEYRQTFESDAISSISDKLNIYGQINANLWHTDSSHYAFGAGIGAQYQLTPQWGIELGWGGVWLDDRLLTATHDMGSQANFETTLGLRYQIDSQSALKLNLYHWSNAHLASTNPGSEMVLLGYQFSY